MKISLITTIYNEKPCLDELYTEISSVFNRLKKDYEVIAVDDGSKDGSLDLLRKIADKDKRWKIISFRFNTGKTAAILAGLEHAKGDIVVMMDSDLENDPSDIPMMLEKLSEGFDVVSGWRKDRWADKKISRKLPSIVANKLISKITGVSLHDYGCPLKVSRRDAFDELKLYGEMHRFITAYAYWRGARIAEVPVNHRPRKHGRSNYGISRVPRVLLDLLLIKFMDKFINRPAHFFGGIGLMSLIIGFFAGTTAVVLKILDLRSFVSTPLPIFSALFIIVGVQLIMMGILAEIIIRTYYESQNKKIYIIREKINFDDKPK